MAADLFGDLTAPAPNQERSVRQRPAGQFGRPRRPSRADLIMAKNTTPKRLAAQTKRSLNSARATLERLAVPWAEIDNSVEFEMEVLLAAFEAFEQHIDTSVEWLLEPAPYE